MFEISEEQEALLRLPDPSTFSRCCAGRFARRTPAGSVI